MQTDAALKALAHPIRRRMLELTWHQERTSSFLAHRVQMSAPATSQHLKVLRQAGLISVRPLGTRRYYRANPESIDQLRHFLERFWGSRLQKLKDAAERRLRDH